MISEYVKSYIRYRVFDDVQEMLSRCQSAPTDPKIQTWKRPDRVGERFSSWSQVLHKAETANPVVTKAIDDMVEALEDADVPEPIVHKRMPVYREDEGDELDIDRLRNAQSYWRSMRRQATVGSQVKTIVINMSTRITVSHSNIHWRGAAAVALCHLLEDAGYRVEIWAVHCCSGAYKDGTGHMNAVKLKDAWGEIDVDTISSVVSGWFYRSAWFKLKEWPDTKLVDGAGKPRYVSTEDIEALSLDASQEEEDICVLQEVFSQYNAIWAVKRFLKQYVEPELEEEEDELEQQEVAVEAPPPRKETAAERKRAEAQYRRWQKEWARKNREV